MTVDAVNDVNDADRLFGEEHVRRYRETGGEVGYRWRGATILVLTTRGRTSGEPRSVPLIFDRDGDRFVIVASKGGAPRDPGWYRNLVATPEAEVQVLARAHRVRARTAEGEERDRLWKLMTRMWPAYDEYQGRTARTIPVVVLEPAE
jgi:deazaflavin-dependent oxidoreductase (nitroreductase family)